MPAAHERLVDSIICTFILTDKPSPLSHAPHDLSLRRVTGTKHSPSKAWASNSIGPKVFSKNIPKMDMPQRIAGHRAFDIP